MLCVHLWNLSSKGQENQNYNSFLRLSRNEEASLTVNHGNRFGVLMELPARATATRQARTLCVHRTEGWVWSEWVQEEWAVMNWGAG